MGDYNQVNKDSNISLINFKLSKYSKAKISNIISNAKEFIKGNSNP